MTKIRKQKKLKRSSKRHTGEEELRSGLHPETKRAVFAIGLFVLSVIVFFSLIKQGGVVGTHLYNILFLGFGAGAWMIPILLILSGIILLRSSRQYASIFIGGIIGITSFVGFLGVAWQGSRLGGYLGFVVASFLQSLFGLWLSIFILLGVFIIAALIFVNLPIFWRKHKEEGDLRLEDFLSSDFGPQKKHGLARFFKRIIPKPPFSFQRLKTRSLTHEDLTTHLEKEREDTKEHDGTERITKQRITYRKPPLDLLDPEIGESSGGNIKANVNIIKRTLQNFGIDVEMGEVNIGPTVTQYTLKPAEGVKLSKITALVSDLSLALASHPIRIEAPIPGKALVGIEVPNKQTKLVRIRDLVSNQNFSKAPSDLFIALGQDVAGNPVFADLEKMPHLLIAGSTGSGKTIALNCIITSFLYRNSPRTLRFILIDPKRVEFPVYNGLPHLLTPVITNVNKTVSALRWLVGEMERRFEVLAASEARDIIAYNSMVAQKGSENEDILPYLVVMIDELADLMAAKPKEIESSIVRLAQMARAVGIHLIIATQRPSVEVITGLIKANITSRMAFQVASQVDSRTILDMAGAEKLLGNGDMLFMSAENAKPKRVQGAFLSDVEIKRITNYIKETQKTQNIPKFDEEEILEGASANQQTINQFDNFDGGKDEMYEEAKQLVLETRRASASFLQRRLSIGYARAARLLDIMEEKGIIGPGEGAKPRDVYGGNRADTYDDFGSEGKNDDRV